MCSNLLSHFFSIESQYWTLHPALITLLEFDSSCPELVKRFLSSDRLLNLRILSQLRDLQQFL